MYIYIFEQFPHGLPVQFCLPALFCTPKGIPFFTKQHTPYSNPPPSSETCRSHEHEPPASPNSPVTGRDPIRPLSYIKYLRPNAATQPLPRPPSDTERHPSLPRGLSAAMTTTTNTNTNTTASTTTNTHHPSLLSLPILPPGVIIPPRIRLLLPGPSPSPSPAAVRRPAGVGGGVGLRRPEHAVVTHAVDRDVHVVGAGAQAGLAEPGAVVEAAEGAVAAAEDVVDLGAHHGWSFLLPPYPFPSLSLSP